MFPRLSRIVDHVTWRDGVSSWVAIETRPDCVPSLLFMKRFLLICVFVITIFAKADGDDTVRVLIWDERQDKQSEAYDEFLGNEIAKRLEALSAAFEIRSVGIDDPEQGIAADDLDWADVMIWWGHVRQWEIAPETAQRKIIRRLKFGKLDLIFLHSAHWATPFMEAMNEKTKGEAKQRYPDTPGQAPIEFEYLPVDGRFPPARDSVVTPAYLALKKRGEVFKVRVDLPNCCFPAFRPDGKPSELTVVQTEHPIAKGLNNKIRVPMTEMYDEPFHIPTPDDVVFREDWKTGEHFRSGMVWNVGKGQVFYFRPGHETYPVFKQPEMIQILANACRWMAK
ncbi:MAG: ThuA domain-containing protein [Planctomycetota bacterium]